MLEFTGDYQKLGAASVASDRIEVTSEVAGIDVFADIMFEKVLSNFVDNSIRHGQRVRRIRLVLRYEGDSLVLVYEDDKQNLFKRGFGKHTGFGLYLSKEILEFAGFGVKETGIPGTGARFEITVPKNLFRVRQ